MIAVDSNLLVYAHREDSTWHEAAYARIATMCQQHGVSELWTVDRDFGRFSGLTVSHPLVS